MPRRAVRTGPPLSPGLAQAWHHALDVAAGLRELEPWEHVASEAILGVRDPVSGEIDWCTVLGAADEVFGVTMHPGDRGLVALQRTLAGAYDELDAVVAQRATTLTFESAATCAPITKRILKQLGRSYRGTRAWPELFVHEPGLLPRVPDDEAQLERAAHALSAVAVLVPWAHDDPRGGACDPGRAWVLEPPFDASALRQVALPDVAEDAPQPLPIDQVAVAKLANRPARGGTWFADWFCGEGFADEATGRPFVAIHPIVTELETGLILATDVVRLDEAAERLQHLVLRLAGELGLPGRLAVRREDLAVAFGPFASAARVPLLLEPELVAVSRDIHDGLQQFLRR